MRQENQGGSANEQARASGTNGNEAAAEPQWRLYTAAIRPDNAGDRLSLACSASDPDALVLDIDAAFARPHLSGCEAVAVAMGPPETHEGVVPYDGIVLDLANTQDIEVLAVATTRAALVLDHVSPSTRVALIGDSTVVVAKFDDEPGRDHRPTLLLSSDHAAFRTDDVERLHVFANDPSSLFLVANSLQSLTVGGHSPISVIPHNLAASNPATANALGSGWGLVLRSLVEMKDKSRLTSIVPAEETMENLSSIDAGDTESSFLLAVVEHRPLVIQGGRGGQNLIYLAGGKDNTIRTGCCNDVIATGAGNDSIDAGAGNDIIMAGAGANFIATGSGSDLLIIDDLGESRPSHFGPKMTTVWDFDPDAHDRILFRYLSGGRVADSDAQRRVQAVADALDPTRGLWGVLQEASAGMDDHMVSWLHWAGDTYVFAADRLYTSVRLTGLLDLTADNVLFGA